MDLSIHINKALFSTLNVLSGIFLPLFHPFKLGDIIVINGLIGSVETRGLNKIGLKNIDGGKFTISNSLFYTKKLFNLSDEKIVKTDFHISLLYGQDMPIIKNLILDHLASQKLLLKNPTPHISVRKIQSNHVELEITAWCTLDNFVETDSITEVLLKEFLLSKGVSLHEEYLEETKKMMA